MSSEKRLARQAVLDVMARMSLSDGSVSPGERAFLEDQLEGAEPVETLLARVKDQSIAALTEKVPRYEDRFFIALRAYAMAHIDAQFDDAEQAEFATLVSQLRITDEDVMLIEASGEADPDQGDPHPRLQELYERSSFARSA